MNVEVMMSSTQKFVLTLIIFVLVFSVISIALNVYLSNRGFSEKDNNKDKISASNFGNVGLNVETSSSSENYGK